MLSLKHHLHLHHHHHDEADVPFETTDVLPFIPLDPDDTLETYDLELLISPDGKAELYARFRNPSLSGSSSGRPTYKIIKKPRGHLFSKRNLSMIVLRNEAWDVNNSRPVPPSAAGKHAGKGYLTICECVDEPVRPFFGLNVTSNAVLSGMLTGGRMVMSPWCGSYDPHHHHSAGHKVTRDCTAFHFFTLDLTGGRSRARSPTSPTSEKQPTPVPYTGGGHFMFDTHSQGRPDLLATLYCTRYEQRPFVKPGDIVVAELRLNLPPVVPDAPTPPALTGWRRFLQHRHASLYLSKRGLDACFSGPNVQLAIPNAVAGKRYFFTAGQAHEIVLTALAMSIMCIEHEGVDKKWAWMSTREAVEANAERRRRIPRHLRDITQGSSSATLPNTEEEGQQQQHNMSRRVKSQTGYSRSLLQRSVSSGDSGVADLSDGAPEYRPPGRYDSLGEAVIVSQGYDHSRLVPISPPDSPRPRLKVFDPDVAPFLYQDPASIFVHDDDNPPLPPSPSVEILKPDGKSDMFNQPSHGHDP